MDDYQYALMKKTLERLQEVSSEWRKGGLPYREAMYKVETILDEAGFHE
jgi:hypothetical protein